MTSKNFILSLLLLVHYCPLHTSSAPAAKPADADVKTMHAAQQVLNAADAGTHAAPEVVVVKLTPPVLDDAALIHPTSCDRPRRPIGINISLAEQDSKTIVHCYGHGGFGFTTLFGSIQEAIKLLLDKNPNKDTPIRVIGSGCMGLTMAAELHARGFHKITISTKERFNIPSWRAGGFFDPGTGKETSPVDKYRVELGVQTYHVLRTIEQGNHPYLKPNVVRPLPIYYPADIECEVEILEQMKVMPAQQLVTLDFGNGACHPNYQRRFTYFINITELMQQLEAQCNNLRIPIVTEEVTAFARVTEPIVINCTGLGSKVLNNDEALQPARGHFFMLPQAQQALDYMLFTKVLQNAKKEYVYFFPKLALRKGEQSVIESSGMLGGTFVLLANSTPAELQQLDEAEYKKLTERARQFFYGKTLEQTKTNHPKS